MLSIGQLCDDDCLALFSKRHLWALKYNKIILSGIRNTTDVLWDVPFNQQQSSTITTPNSTSPVPSYNHSSCYIDSSIHISTNHLHTQQAFPLSLHSSYILTLDKSKYEIAQYLYGCLFAPAIPTLETTIRKGNLQSWSGIETINFKKYVGKMKHIKKDI